MSVNERLTFSIETFKEIRDGQREIECSEGGCICEQFDLIIDEIESLRDKFGKLNEFKLMEMV